MLDKIENFFDRHSGSLFAVFMILVIDHLFFNGALKNKIMSAVKPVKALDTPDEA